MIEIKGKYNEAKIFTDVVDSASIAQVQELCNQEFTAGSRIRLMPDIHAGAGCTIGTTMTITDKVVLECRELSEGSANIGYRPSTGNRYAVNRTYSVKGLSPLSSYN